MTEKLEAKIRHDKCARPHKGINSLCGKTVTFYNGDNFAEYAGIAQEQITIKELSKRNKIYIFA